ncbi:MAG: DNA repair protein RecN [Verrucomicrobia bacterium]|nr:DNA repair protein RecN [Verrucomicrobiota bacterium]
MLTTLRIRNLALVTDLTLELPPGFIAITGETGAGKSIIIGALNLLLGERADRTLIRSGEEACSVEAVFDLGPAESRINTVLDSYGIEPTGSGQLLLKRTFTVAGTNRQYVNGSPTTLQALAAIGEWLVDVHGPHDHQSLLHPNRQLAILDAFGNHGKLLDACADTVRKLAKIQTEKAALVMDEQEHARQLDLLRFQVREIEEARLRPGEDEEVAEAYRRAQNAARIFQLGRSALGILDEDENSISTQAGAVGRFLKELVRIDSGAEPIFAAHEQFIASLNELQNALGRYVDLIETDPAQLTSIEERFNLIQSLKKKYGTTIESILETGAQCRKRLETLEQREAELARLEAEQRKLEDTLWQQCTELSAKRRRVIPQLATAVSRELADLGFKQSRFEIQIVSLEHNQVSAESAQRQIAQPSATGIDTVEFIFAPNPGEPPRPLRAIASSGEMARVMLALKTVLAAHDEIPVLMFDEVDANIGGETANAVGRKLRQIANHRQVFCITHLPQVAAAATAHFVVEKEVRAGRTVSTMRLLNPDEQLIELARMFGGQTEAARQHAAALIRQHKQKR